METLNLEPPRTTAHYGNIGSSPQHLLRGMLGCARQRAVSQGVRNLELIEMDMQLLDFEPEAFDLAVCAFGIFFIENLAVPARARAKARPHFRDEHVGSTWKH